MTIPPKVGRGPQLIALVVLSVMGSRAEPQGDQCVVSVLNRTVQATDGNSWVLPSVPANLGRVRARLTCVEGGVTRFGHSDWFTIPPNGVMNLPPITVTGALEQIPARLSISAPAGATLAASATVQLLVRATFATGGARDITSPSLGTNYTISNPAIATVSSDGLVTAVSSGTVLVTAMNDGATGMIRLQVVTSSDSDGDGIPDDVELANGMNPNDPVDALEDFDRDGLTNRDEIARGTGLRNPDTDADGLLDGREPSYGTDPLLWDTDGDGISDGLEVQSGSNPTDSTSTNLGPVLQSISASPGTLLIAYSTLLGETSRRLTVTGTLLDGRSIDLTSRSRGTNYASSNLSIANFGGDDGEVFAGLSGSTTITVSTAGHSAIVPVTVTSFSPRQVGWVSVPGFANDVAVAGRYAYVAAGGQGLQVVDVEDKARPAVVASLALSGNANDVVISGDLAYVAAGASGLHVVDISNPLVPVRVGGFDTAGIAFGLAAQGARVFLADGPQGIVILDATDPTQPRLLGSVATPGVSAVAVAVQGNLAVVAASTSLLTVDVTDVARPTIRGAIQGLLAQSVALSDDGAYGYVAAYTSSLRVVDLRNPDAPVDIAGTPPILGGFLWDVATSGDFTFGADSYFVNGVPITDRLT